jgi:hypothetical protein
MLPRTIIFNVSSPHMAGWAIKPGNWINKWFHLLRQLSKRTSWAGEHRPHSKLATISEMPVQCRNNTVSFWICLPFVTATVWIWRAPRRLLCKRMVLSLVLLRGCGTLKRLSLVGGFKSYGTVLKGDSYTRSLAVPDHEMNKLPLLHTPHDILPCHRAKAIGPLVWTKTSKIMSQSKLLISQLSISTICYSNGRVINTMIYFSFLKRWNILKSYKTNEQNLLSDLA